MEVTGGEGYINCDYRVGARLREKGRTLRKTLEKQFEEEKGKGTKENQNLFSSFAYAPPPYQ